MKLHQFYKEFENTPTVERFHPINTRPESVSLFVIFKRLEGVRAQRRYFEDEEARLLAIAELGFNQLKNKKDGNSEAT